ncbi:MAG: DUF1211 domain-containing protein [Alphaproteobacteria bacterium]|nr:DUF1211 domain-containing protein [Alphaproteobacteria bacterium]MDE1985055.1 DUF1211 domain-containing protein [Alphaproteobacteria bacterium]MDE2162396.1 DUF1211 domain-containing protein [Alphaproteobacteria bacterium]MDE2266467.1 DUF1211 domain-containing protein [Alphaproteobacteria bacterium]MDE2498740.1 DUF1211 domain-containing protein [Alphaproteobacteria bacterium]
MPTYYNRIAGQSLQRLEALSDGIFAVAMTILVLDLHAPVAAAVHSERDLWHALVLLAPRLVTYLMSFMTLGIFWVGQQTQHNLLAKSDRSYAWINLAFLMAVTLVPFSTSLLAEFITYRLALLIYWLNILVLGLLIAAQLYRARHFGLLKEEMSHEFHVAILRRVVIAQTLYAFGAALCIFSTWWSIGFIVAVQLIYAIAPRFKPFTWM